ncbi:MAG: enoyl-CoA hydratase/isomerase family protein [Gemmatimonadaceae bacterium]|nr:enoyl-CoA hydratase/isomerase family protein [Gemmatimonadaceae bacterium]
MTEHIQLERSGMVLTIRMARPEKKNALTVDMYRAMTAALHDAATSDETRVVVITGTGDAFTSGNDLRDFATAPPMDADSPVLQFLAAISTFAKPVVAAVNGVAVGIGTTMLLHCDLIVADPAARFALPFINLGLVPEAASSLILPRMLGHPRAAELLLLGEAFDAETAARYGIVNTVCEPGEAEWHAMGWAEALAAKAPAALRLSKALLKREDGVIADRIAVEARDFAAQLRGPEFREAVSAFMEKRPPRFG